MNTAIKKSGKRILIYVLTLVLWGTCFTGCLGTESAQAETLSDTLGQIETASTKACSYSDPVMKNSTAMKTCYQYFHVKKGYNLAITCAILANIQVECEFDPENHSPYLGKDYYGLAQWTDSRLTGLKSYCKANNLKYNTVEGQIAYIYYEANNTQYPQYVSVKNMKVENSELGAVYASWLWSYYYERCATYVFECRQVLARKYWDYFTSGSYIDPEVTVKSTDVSFPSKVGKKDSYSFSGTVKCSEKIDRIETGIAYYTDYSGDADALKAERSVRIGSAVTDPKTITVKPGASSYKLSKIKTTWNFNNLATGTYTYYLTAYVDGIGYTVLEKNFKVVSGNVLKETVPSAPTVKAAAGNGKITVKWSSVTGAKSYIVYRKTGSGSYVKLANVSSGTKSYQDKTVKNGTTYTYGVRAVCSIGNTKLGTAKRTYFSPVTIKLSNTSSGIQLSWSKKTGATGYIIYRHAEGGTFQKLTKISSGNTTSYVDKQVVDDNGALYSYAVKATNGTYSGAYVGKSYYRVRSPRNVKVSKVSTKSMKITWSGNLHAKGYQIQYALDKKFKTGKKTITVTGAKTVKKTISGLKKNKKYYVRMRAYIKSGSKKYYSAWSTS